MQSGMTDTMRMTWFLTAAVAGFLAAGSAALAQQPTEVERLQQCDRDLCGIALKPSEPGAALQCDLTKTWPKEQINEAWTKKHISWPFGDARCSGKLNVDRVLLASAITNAQYMLNSPTQSVSCEVDREGARYPLAVTLTPKVQFKDGKATTVWLNVEKIEGNAVIKGVVWTAAKMEANFGVFQKDLLKGINEYISDYCQKTYGKPM